jgi:16S rRNA (guanine(1405)-N(7))-methyltransferase
MDEDLQNLVAAVQAGAKYRHIDPALVRAIGAAELKKQRSFKDAVKATRNKLHQVGSAYQEAGIPYERLAAGLDALGAAPDPHALRAWCRGAMQLHASTQERLPLLERFFAETLATIAPLESVLDLACGLNPLAIPWMPLAPGARYFACDIYADMTSFLNHFFPAAGVDGQAWVCDLAAAVPQQAVQVALLLKTIPCLEQLDKSIGARLLDAVPAEHLLVSFPARSLGGRSKGMRGNYATHFHALAEGRFSRVLSFQFASEIAFLASR